MLRVEVREDLAFYVEGRKNEVVLVPGSHLVAGARVVRDEAIPLSVEERADPRKIDALRNRIKGVSPDA